MSDFGNVFDHVLAEVAAVERTLGHVVAQAFASGASATMALMFGLDADMASLIMHGLLSCEQPATSPIIKAREALPCVA